MRCAVFPQPPVLDDAEIAMVLAVFLAIRAAQKHASAAECQKCQRLDKRQGLHPGLFSRARVDSIDNFLAITRKTDAKCGVEV